MLFKLDSHMKESIEFFKMVDYAYSNGTLSAISGDEESYAEYLHHSEKVLKYFNDFDSELDNENFMKCLHGHYEVKNSAFKIICPACERAGVSVGSTSIECKHCGFVEEI